MEKLKLEVGTEYPIAMVDAIIETQTSRDPSPPIVLATLLNPIHTIDMVAKDGINIQPCIEVVYNVNQNVSHDNMVSKSVGTLKDPGLSIAAPSTPYSPVVVPPNHLGVGLNVMEMLWCILNSKMLKELHEMLFAQVCQEQGEQRGASSFVEGLLPKDFLRVPESRKGGQCEVIEYAYNLRNIAQFLATAAPSLLEATLGLQ